ncbi:hypothetical protein JCM8097_001012 [Rhodosporidiobolus ruineniae]
MHARLARSSRLAARAAVQLPRASVVAVAAPTFASPAHSSLSTRLFRTSPFLSSQDAHIPLPSKPESATPADAPKDDPSAHAVGEQEGHISLDSTASSSSSAPSSSPAPIDDAAATSLPTEEVPAVSSSLDATHSSSTPSSSSEPSSSPAPIDDETSTTLPTEEIPAVSSSLDATAAAEAAQDKVSRTVFVGGLSWNVDKDWLEDEVLAILDRTDGISEIRIARDAMGRSKGFAFVELSSDGLARQLIGTKPVIDGRQVEFSASTSPTQRQTKPSRLTSPQGEARHAPTNTVWLGNVAWSADEALLEKIFARFGPIARIGQPKDFETGRTRGIAYIEFETVEAAEEAVKVGLARGFRVDGRPVKIDFADKEKRGNNKGRLGGGSRDGKMRGRRTESAAGGRFRQ